MTALPEDINARVKNALSDLSMEEPPKPKPTIISTVRECYGDIQALFEQGFTLSQVTEALTSAGMIDLTEASLKRHLRQIDNELNPKAKAKPKRGKSSSRKVNKVTDSLATESPVNEHFDSVLESDGLHNRQY